MKKKKKKRVVRIVLFTVVGSCPVSNCLMGNCLVSNCLVSNCHGIFEGNKTFRP